MATIAELKYSRAQAAAAYVSAAHAFVDAWVELHAFDQALSNANVGIGTQRGLMGAPQIPTHAEFMTAPIHGAAIDRAKVRAVHILKTLS